MAHVPRQALVDAAFKLATCPLESLRPYGVRLLTVLVTLYGHTPDPLLPGACKEEKRLHRRPPTLPGCKRAVTMPSVLRGCHACLRAARTAGGNPIYIYIYIYTPGRVLYIYIYIYTYIYITR